MMPPASLPTAVLTPTTRAAHVPQGYSVSRHIARTSMIAAAIAAIALWLARDAAAADWLLLPLFLVVANAIEWAFHKGPMHHPTPPRALYEGHALVHHRAFLEDSMEVREARELALVLMPWPTMIGLFVLATPVALLFAAWRGVGAAGVFYLGAVAYFLVYEALHALYHAPAPLLARLGAAGALVRRLKPHHRHHHRLDRMAHVNFNVTFPLMDRVMGTLETEGAAPRGRAWTSTKGERAETAVGADGAEAVADELAEEIWERAIEGEADAATRAAEERLIEQAAEDDRAQAEAEEAAEAAEREAEIRRARAELEEELRPPGSAKRRRRRGGGGPGGGSGEGGGFMN